MKSWNLFGEDMVNQGGFSLISRSAEPFPVTANTSTKSRLINLRYIGYQGSHAHFCSGNSFIFKAKPQFAMDVIPYRQKDGAGS
jgi:hypothetical protein